jgi:hypothetical protein
MTATATATPTPKKPAAAPTAKPDVTRFLAVTEDLIALVEAETTVLRSKRPGDIAQLRDLKELLCHAYLAQCTALRDMPAAFNEAPTQLQDQARAAGMRLAAALEANEKQLRIATIAADRVVGAIVKAVHEKRSEGLNYKPPRASTRQAPVASGFMLDRRL